MRKCQVTQGKYVETEQAKYFKCANGQRDYKNYSSVSPEFKHKKPNNTLHRLNKCEYFTVWIIIKL